jgi:hypothetical protein
MTGPLVDDRGRLFGRLNLVDAAIGVFVLVLIPLGYMAFLLFRSSKPVIASVDPAPLTYIEDRASGGTQVSGKLKVRGSGLQPVLRATIGPRSPSSSRALPPPTCCSAILRKGHTISCCTTASRKSPALHVR